MMMDIDYLLATLEAKHNGISLFIDTCGYVPYEAKQILPADTFLYDLKKCMDDELHTLG